jgi:hypothetical protein
MGFGRYHRGLSLHRVALLAFLACPLSVFGQGPLPDAPLPSIQLRTTEVHPIISTTTTSEMSHRFWDKKNCALFTASAALSGADFAVTRANLQNGGQEFNPIVRILGRSTAALVLNFAGENGGVIGLSYLFHRTGHHKMERTLTLVNTGVSVGAVAFGAARR